MKISLSPQRGAAGSLDIFKTGDALAFNGEVFDFTALPDGATIPAGEVPCPWIVGPVHRVAGELQLTVLLPVGPSPSQAQAFPAPIIDPADGPIALPGA